MSAKNGETNQTALVERGDSDAVELDNGSAANTGVFDPLAFDDPEVTEATSGFQDTGAGLQFERVGDPITQPAQPAQDTHTDEDPREKHRGKISEKGERYDPSLHRFPPVETPGGRWSKIPKREREHTPEQIDNARIRTSARNLANMYGQAHRVPFGIKGGAVHDAADLDSLADALERHMMQNGIIETNPTVDVIFNAVLYSGEVAQRPENNGRVKYWRVSTKARLYRLFGIELPKNDFEYLVSVGKIKTIEASAPPETETAETEPGDNRFSDDDEALKAAERA